MCHLPLSLQNFIPNAELIMYPQWGHGLYEEEKEFNQVILDYLNK